MRQRLKLANVAPRLFELYRTDEINLDQLMALAVTDDHAAQEWQRQPHALRRALTDTIVDVASDPRVRFVGIETYLNAGGLLEQDLFQAEHEGYLTDAAKLERLTAEKLEALRAFTEKILPGRWTDARQPNERELKATSILKLPLTEASAKVRTGGVEDDADDYALPVWAGIVPLRLVADSPIRDERCDPGLPTPIYATNFRR